MLECGFQVIEYKRIFRRFQRQLRTSASQDDGKTDGIHLIHYPDSIIYRQRDSGVTVNFFFQKASVVRVLGHIEGLWLVTIKVVPTMRTRNDAHRICTPQPQARTALYKIVDRDGMYVAVSPAGTISFRYDYRINERREMLTIGRYGRGGISLA